MGLDNLEELKSRLEQLGYVCFRIVVQAIQHGLPEYRPRLWVGAMLWPDAIPHEIVKVQEDAQFMEQVMRQNPKLLNELCISANDAMSASFL